MEEPRIVRWESPPKRDRATGRADWTRVAEQLQARPGQWALVHVTKTNDVEERRARGVAAGISKATLTAFRPAGSFESSCRKIGDEVRVYARRVIET